MAWQVGMGMVEDLKCAPSLHGRVVHCAAPVYVHPVYVHTVYVHTVYVHPVYVHTVYVHPVFVHTVYVHTVYVHPVCMYICPHGVRPHGVRPHLCTSTLCTSTRCMSTVWTPHGVRPRPSKSTAPATRNVTMRATESRSQNTKTAKAGERNFLQSRAGRLRGKTVKAEYLGLCTLVVVFRLA